MKINDKVYLQYKAYLIWIMQTTGLIDLTALMHTMAEEVDYDNPGIIKGFQSPEFDGRDTIVRWKNFLWDTSIPSQFLIADKLIEKKGGKTCQSLD